MNNLEKIKYEFNGIDVRNFLDDKFENIDYSNVIGLKYLKQYFKDKFAPDEATKKFQEDFHFNQNNFILLYGLPGCGKTYFANALANEFKENCDSLNHIKFFEVKISNLFSNIIGQTPQNIGAMFEFLCQFERSCLIIDEIEKLLPNSNYINDGFGRFDINKSFLYLTDKYTHEKGGTIIGLTSQPYMIDSTILAHMLQKKIELPTAKELYEYLNQEIGKILDDDCDLEKVSIKLNELNYSYGGLMGYNNSLRIYLFNQNLNDKSNCISKDASLYKISSSVLEDSLSKLQPLYSEEEILKINQFKN